MAKQLQQLRTNVRVILDETSAADWSDAQIDTEINWCYMEMYTAVIDVYEDYYRTVSNNSFVANTNEYALPDDFFKIRRLEAKYESGADYFKVTPYSFDQIVRGISSTNIGSTSRPIYQLSGSYLQVLPVPTTTLANAMKLTYIKQITELSANTDTIDLPFPDRYGKYIIKGACAQLLSKGQQEERIASSYEAYFQLGLRKMKEELETRYADGVKMIQDLSGTDNNFSENRVVTGILI